MWAKVAVEIHKDILVLEGDVSWYLKTKPCLKGTNMCVYIYIYTWNPNDPCFDWKSPCFGGLTFKNRGHLGSRYVYLYL